MIQVPGAITHLNARDICPSPVLAKPSGGRLLHPQECGLSVEPAITMKPDLAVSSSGFEMKMSGFKIGQRCQRGDAWKQKNIYGNKT